MPLVHRLLNLLAEDSDDDPTPDVRSVRLSDGAIVGRIMFVSQFAKTGRGLSVYLPSNIRALLTGDEQHKVNSAEVVLVPDPTFTAYLGAPVKWVAPNGVLVVYCRGQRRSGSAEKTGEGSSGTYHDFNSEDEYIVPATRNVGPGRRALRAWAQQFMQSSVTARMQAKQLVRPGD